MTYKNCDHLLCSQPFVIEQEWPHYIGSHRTGLPGKLLFCSAPCEAIVLALLPREEPAEELEQGRAA